MATIPQKELRSHVAEVLRRADAGEEFTTEDLDRLPAELADPFG